MSYSHVLECFRFIDSLNDYLKTDLRLLEGSLNTAWRQLQVCLKPAWRHHEDWVKNSIIITDRQTHTHTQIDFLSSVGAKNIRYRQQNNTRHSFMDPDLKLTNIFYEMMLGSKFTECKGFLFVSLIHKMGLQNICQIWFLTKAPVNSSNEVPFSALTHNSISWLGVFLVEGWREFLWII